MKYLSFLALVPFLTLFLQTTAEAKHVASAPAEEALSLPWESFVREDVSPSTGTKLLTTFHIGSRLDTFHIPLANCGNDVLAVNLKVQHANVTVQSFGVRFNDGGTRDFSVNKVFNAGTESGWIDLGLFRAMDPRCPVDVFAKAQASGSATVFVYGNMK